MTVPGERELADRIFHGIPDVLGVDRERYAGRRVLVVGAGYSAANVLLSLATLADANGNTRMAWAVRGRSPRRLFGTGEPDELEARGALGAAVKALSEAGNLELIERFRIVAVEAARAGADLVGLVDGAETRFGPFDEIVAATGHAVVDALSPLGIRHFDMPATPERVWRAIRGASERSVSQPT